MPVVFGGGYLAGCRATLSPMIAQATQRRPRTDLLRLDARGVGHVVSQAVKPRHRLAVEHGGMKRHQIQMHLCAPPNGTVSGFEFRVSDLKGHALRVCRMLGISEQNKCF